MGFLDWITNRKQPSNVVARGSETMNGGSSMSRPVKTMRVTVTAGSTPLVQVTGTTTFAKAGAVALVDRRGLPDRTELLIQGSLQREPENIADHNAVAVFADGEKIGYLPSYVASELSISTHGSASVSLQVFCLRAGSKTRVEAWAWLEGGRPKWKYGPSTIPPLTPEEKRTSEHRGRRDMVQDALGGGGQRAEQFKTGMVDGIHYLESVEPIKQLKREGKLEEALTLCYIAIEGAERAREGSSPAPWYTEQAAIIHRKLGQKDQEIAVLERWLRATPPKHRGQNSISDRLAKIKR